MMNWQQLLTPQRLGKDAPDPPEVARSSFQRDYDRLIFSSAFRRLKDKTQVFPLAKVDYIRTRLIHSMEVSCVGRSLGTLVGERVIERHNLSLDIKPSDFSNIVFAACVAHDIGNPPFGHSGEDSIREAFKAWNHSERIQPSLNDGQKADLELFEGNAQGFRILTRLEMAPREGGMRLNCPTLAAFMKYPRESYIPQEILELNNGKSIKKFGFFQAEKELFSKVAEAVGLIKRHPEHAWWARHPLTFLVEAADDICYNIIDLEDGYRMGLITFEEAEELLNGIANQDSSEDKQYSKSERIKHLRALAINTLIHEAADIFNDEENNILQGIFDKDLISESRFNNQLREIQALTRQKIFNSSEVVRVQIAGFEVIGNLFSKFIDAAFNPGSPQGKLIISLLPEESRPEAECSSYEKILKITDFLSGMTDSYARDIFQELCGISLNH